MFPPTEECAVLCGKHFTHDDKRHVGHATRISDEEDDQRYQGQPAQFHRGFMFSPHLLEVEEDTHPHE